MTPEGLARTHAAAFGGDGWPAADFERYLQDENALVFGTDACFVVLRIIHPEAEVLTLATAPDAQGRGHATAMLHAALHALERINLQKVFLDVAEDNTAARALYARCGFVEFARRKDYYKNNTSAICMKARLSPGSPS